MRRIFPRSRVKGRTIIGAVAVAAILSTAACSSTEQASTGADETAVLRVALSADPRSLYPNSSTVQAEINVSQQITEKLFDFSSDNSEIEPHLATSWEQPDDTSLVIHLREDVSFTNGEAFNADSVVYSLDVFKNATAYGSYTGLIDTVTKIDDYTVEVTAPTPTAQLITSIARGAYQYPPAYFEEVGEEGFGTAPIGTGPFVFESWDKGATITLTRNDDYWGQTASLSGIEFSIIPDKSAQIAALQSGQVDFIIDVPMGSIETIESDSALALVTRDSDRMYYLTYSMLTDTPLQDPKVRQALWYAVDAQALVDNQLGGMGKVLEGQIISSSYFGFDPSVSAVEYDPEKAKQLLAEAGYPDGFEFTFKYSSGRYVQDVELGQAIAAQFAEIGVTANQEVLESGTFLTQLLDLELNDMYFGGSLTVPDAHFMYAQFESSAPYSYYRNSDFDALMAQETAEPDNTAREAIIHEITNLFLADPPFIPLFQGTDTYGISTAVTGFETRASQFTDFSTVSISN